MSKTRIYTFSQPCQSCATPQSMVFKLTDSQALRVAQKLEADRLSGNTGAYCKTCAALLREKTKPVSSGTAVGS